MKRRPKVTQVYSWKNSEFKNIDATVAVDALDAIKTKHGQIKNAIIVEEARAENHPFHDIFFFHDESKAAQIGREAIAARLVRSIKVSFVAAPGRPPIDTRAFVSMPDPNAKGSRSYQALSFALDSEEGRAVIIRQAWLQLRAWRRRYGEFTELAEAFDAIDRVLEKMG